MKPVAMKPVSKHSPTIRDVARAAGVSPGTVSRVLNNSPLVTPATREHVLNIVAEMDYRPNLIAQRLSLGKTLRISTIVPFFNRPAEIERLRGVVSALSQSQYDLIIHNVENNQQRDEYYRQIPRRQRVDGVVVISLPPGEEIAAHLSESDVPIVFIDVHHDNVRMFDRVLNDDVQGGYLATRHLIELGHRKIGFIGDLPDDPFGFTSSQDRYQGYCQALQETHIPLDARYVGRAEHGRNTAQTLSQTILQLPDRPTAIFAASDTQAMGVITAARQLGLSVPEEVSIIGFDDIEIAEYLGLTTIGQQLFESGQVGVNLLLERMVDPERAPVKQEIENHLIHRTTTCSPN
jgi:DNA-binding LacI/PurR family transcriptional regulator